MLDFFEESPFHLFRFLEFLFLPVLLSEFFEQFFLLLLSALNLLFVFLLYFKLELLCFRKLR
jgi:hypothetical protein